MRTSADFPYLQAAIEMKPVGWQQKSLGTVIDTINRTGEVPNVEYKNAKESLNTALAVAERFYQDAFRAAQTFGGYTPGKRLDFMSAAHAEGKLKIAAKTKFTDPTWTATVKEIATLHEALETLKDRVVKRKLRSEEERADDYVPPLPTTKAAKECEAILHTLTDDLTRQYQAILFGWFVKDVEALIAQPRKRSDRSMPSWAESILMPMVGDDWDSLNGCYKSLKRTYKAILQERAKRDANYAQAMFIYKNVMKLATIIETKATPYTHKVLSGRVSSHGFTGEILFEFNDGSKFNVRNKVVAKYSVNNRGFHQFPTTFHFAVLPSGATMPGQPSQEQMNDIFAKA